MSLRTEIEQRRSNILTHPKPEYRVGYVDALNMVLELLAALPPVACPNCGCDYTTAQELRDWKDEETKGGDHADQGRESRPASFDLQAAVLAERERCAQIAEHFNIPGHSVAEPQIMAIAAAIRALQETR